MKINVVAKILDYEGKPIKEGEQEIDWADVVSTSLNSQLPGEQLTAEDKVKCFQITSKVYASKTPDLTLSERNFILERVKKIYNPLIVGRAIEYFDKPEPTAES
jgi:hypothetical protein